MQADTKALQAVISGVIARHVSASSADASMGNQRSAGQQQQETEAAEVPVTDGGSAAKRLADVPSRASERIRRSTDSQSMVQEDAGGQAGSQDSLKAAMEIILRLKAIADNFAHLEYELDDDLENDPEGIRGLLTAISALPGNPNHITCHAKACRTMSGISSSICWHVF